MEKMLAVVAALLILSFSAVGYANEAAVGACNQTGQNVGQPTLGSYTGEVVSIDQNLHSIVVKGDYGSRTFDVSKLPMKDVPGLRDIATVEYENTNGKMVASSVISVPQQVSTSMWWLHETNV